MAITHPQLPPGVVGVAEIPAPGGGKWILGADGGVFAVDGAPYLGSYQGLDAGTKNDPNRTFTGIEAAGNGYALTSGTGERYQFDGQGGSPPAPDQAAAPSLYSNPAFLAFLRSSGLGIETAANDVAKREGAINVALASKIPELQEQGRRNLRGIDNSFESRGVFRSGTRMDKRAESEYDTNNLIAGAETDAANQVGELKSSLAQTVANQAGRGAELGLSLDSDAYGREQDKFLGGLKTTADDAYEAARRKMMEYR